MFKNNATINLIYYCQEDIYSNNIGFRQFIKKSTKLYEEKKTRIKLIKLDENGLKPNYRYIKILVTFLYFLQNSCFNFFCFSSFSRTCGFNYREISSA